MFSCWLSSCHLNSYKAFTLVDYKHNFAYQIASISYQTLFAVSYRAWFSSTKGLPHPPGSISFISRSTTKACRSYFIVYSVVLPHHWLPFNGDVLNLTARTYIDSIFTIYFVSIILTILLYSIHFFIPSYWIWSPGTLYYSLLI